jgi:polyisoprenoid-binding protein YceI/Flp pilus assembly protein TadD
MNSSQRMRIVASFGALVLASLAPVHLPAQQKNQLLQFDVDQGESIFEFSIDFAFSRVKGRMSTVNGTILYDPANPANSSVTVVLEAKSLVTGSALRDRHLKTSDFLDIEQYPTVKFQSTRLHRGKNRSQTSWLMDGLLTMHGVTKAMTLPLTLNPPRRNPASLQPIITGKTSFRIARKDFGITGGSKYNAWFNAARMAMMADSVDMNIEIEGWNSDAASQRLPQIVAAIERIKTQGLDVQLDRFKAQIAGKPDSVLTDYLAGPDYLVRQLLEEDRPRALELAKQLPALYKGSRAYAVYGHALAVAGDSAGAARQYAQAKRLFKRKVSDPNDPYALIDSDWYYLDELARTSIERGHIAAALGISRLAAELFPDMARGIATYGWALHLAGNDAAASEQFARALKVNPNDSRAIELARRIHA